MLSNEEILIVLRRKINSDRDQKAAAMDQTTGRDRLLATPALHSIIPHLLLAFYAKSAPQSNIRIYPFATIQISGGWNKQEVTFNYPYN
jgi:hypothetical protein